MNCNNRPGQRAGGKHFICKVLSLALLLMSSPVSAQLFALSMHGKVQGYLFGSTHRAIYGVPIQFKRLERAIADSRFVVLETAEGISNELQHATLPLDQQSDVHGLAEEGVKPCIREAYDEMVQVAGARPSLNLDFRSAPFFFANRYFGFSVDRYYPAVVKSGYDQLILEFARKKKLNIASLESAQEKLEIVNSFQSRDSYAILSTLCQLRHNDAARDMFIQFNVSMGDYYTAEDTDQLARNHLALYSFLGASEDFLKKFMADRNDRMASKIEKMTKNGYRPFVAIGAAHLGGGNGIVSQLKAAGFDVRWIPANDTHQ